MVMAFLVVLAAAAAASVQAGRSVVQHHASAQGWAAMPATAASMHRFRGTVTSLGRHHSFRMHTTTGRRVRIDTDDRTTWRGCGWDDMHHGARMDVRARRAHGHWMATHVQRRHRDADDAVMGPGMMD